MLQTLEESGHVEFCEIGELEPRCVAAKLVLYNGLEVTVMGCHATHYDHVFGVGQQAKRHFQGLPRVHDRPNAQKVGVELRRCDKGLWTSADDNWRVRERRFMGFGHEFSG